jgi:23S rRNA (adenine2503-C2)-methyltransferase
MKKNIFDEQALDEFLSENKIEKFRKKQIFQEIFSNQHIDFNEMTTLSTSLREGLSREFSIVSLELDTLLEDDQTTKFAFRTHDGKIVEAVLMYHFSKVKTEHEEIKNPVVVN